MKLYRIITLSIAWMMAISAFSTKISPVIISEVFYDSPLNEYIDPINYTKPHHNGEFIELYNPSTSDIDISGWRINDSNTTPYVFPENSKITARNMVIVAYRYPNSNFNLSDLFPSINALGVDFLQKNIYYQCGLILNNKGEVISLSDKEYRLIDQMSYKMPDADGVRAYNWNVSAANGYYTATNQFKSLQRTDIHITANLTTPTISDYTSTTPTPFDKPANVFFPIVQELNNDPDPNTNGSTPIVGAISGSAAVSPTGAASYSVPIDVPAGINGMQPSISVAYNSQGGFGELGIGWGLSVSSAISRGNKNIYFDGPNNSNIPINFDTSDAIYLDGQRLILLSESGTNLTKDAIYATEVENYSRIVYDGSSFKLTTLDGKIMEYGNTTNNTSNSKLINANGDDGRVLAWKLNKVTDTYGNSITYAYSEHGQYLARIDYAGQSVEFGYDNNSNKFKPKNSYINTFLVSQTKILNTITTKSATTALKTYSFSYTGDNRLQTVNESAPDGTKLGATTVKWGEESKLSKQEVGLNSDPNLIPNNGLIYTGDINGDGYADRIEMWPGCIKDMGHGDGDKGHIAVYFFNKESGTYSAIPDANLLFSYNDDVNIPRSGLTKTKLVISDINNDGKSEIVVTNINYIYCYTYTNNQISKLGDRKSLVVNSSQYYITEIGSNRFNQSFSANVNKDQFNDIIYTYNYDRYTVIGQFLGSVTGYRLFSGSSTGLNDAQDQIKNTKYYDTYQIGDFNADGKIDIFGIPKDANFHSIIDSNVSEYADGKWNSAVNTRHQYSTDFNGDGLSDILFQNKDNYSWKIAYNKGTNNNPDIVDVSFHNASDATGEGEMDEAIAIDYNGDGQVDVVIGDETFDNNGNFVKTTWYFYKNTNGAFTPDGQFDSNARMAYYIADVNGDGIADLVVSDKVDKGYYKWVYPCSGNGTGSTLAQIAPLTNTNPTTDPNCDPKKIWVYNYQNIYTALTFPNANRKYLVNSLVNGMGQAESFSYKNFSGYETYDASEATSIVRPLRAPLLVADTYTLSDGNVTAYKYEKPKVHTEGKGFLGFTTVSATNINKNIKTTSSYDVSDDNLYRVYQKQQTVQTADGKAISTTQLTNGKLYYDTSGNLLVDNNGTVKAETKRYIPIVSSQTVTDILKGVVQTSTSDYGTYPDVMKQTVDIKTIDNKTASTTTITTVNQYKKDGDKTSSLIPYLPKTITTERTADNDTYTRVTAYTYNKKGSVATETKDPGDAGQVITEYSDFDSYGHPLTTTIKAAKDATGTQQSRGIKETYLNGRFLASKTNTLGETTNYSWDESLGTLTSETDAYKHTTSYRYNVWGQLTETTYPNVTHKTSTLQWATNSAVSGAKYYSYNEATVKAPLTVWYDALGREIQRDTYGLNDKKISVSTEYYNTTDVKNGKVLRVSEPYFDGDTKIWAKTYDYDEYGRPKSVKTLLGTSISTYVNLSTTVTSPTEGTHTVETDAEGKTIKSTTNDKTVSYAYYPSGLTQKSTPDGGSSLQMVYDLQGRRTSLIDPDAGTISTTYNGFGELLTETQKVHKDKPAITTTHNYNSNGVLQSIVRNGETTTYSYDIRNRVDSIEIKNKHLQTFNYDDLDRVTKVQEVIDGRIYNTSKKYEDPYGRLTQETYPSGYYTVNSYDKYSNLIAVSDGQGRSIWKAGTENARGQTLTEMKGNVTTTYSYYDNGLTQRMSTPTGNNQIVDMGYTFYGIEKRFCLSSRTDYVKGQHEDFDYDGMNRLTTWTVNNGIEPLVNNTITYNDGGNIEKKSDLGNYTFSYGTVDKDNNSIKPHALNGISGTPSNFSAADLNVTYTDFKKINTLKEGTKEYYITYGVDDQRRKSVYYANGLSQGDPTLTRYYIGGYEEEITSNTIRKIHYLSGAILIQETNQPDKLYYTYSDYQGSLLALADENGNIERYAYDPWGKRRNPSNWNEKDNRTSWLINRGYTGHEHLDAFGIINMNGRVYDPLTAQFFSPDPFVQAPGNWLNYNRYTYCFGNPLRYSDPSGNYTGWDDAAAFLVGAVINWATNGCRFDMSGLGYFVAGGVAGVATLYAPGSFVLIAGGLSSVNSCIGQGFDKSGNNFDFGKVKLDIALGAGVTGCISAYAGGQLAQALHLDKLLSGVQSVLLKHVLSHAISGAVVGGAIGFTGAALNRTDVWSGLAMGASMGLVCGTISGIGSAAQYASQNKVNILNGEPLEIKGAKIQAQSQQIEAKATEQKQQAAQAIAEQVVPEVAQSSSDNVNLPSSDISNSSLNRVAGDGIQFEKNPVPTRTIVGMTEHFSTQATDRGFSPEDIIKIVDEGDIMEAPGRYSSQTRYSLGQNTVIVDKFGILITCFSNAPSTNGLPRGYFVPFK